MAPTEGEVLLDGKRVTGPPKKMAVVFQEYGRSLFPWMRVRDNVELPLKNPGVPKAERNRRVDEALEAVGLSHVPGPTPGSSPAACSSAWRSPAPWPTSPRSC